MACGKFGQEFKCKNFLLDHRHPEYFTTSQWRWPPIVYVLYRVVAALYLLVWLVLSGVLGSDGSFWFIYLTNWSFLMLNLTTVIMAITAILGYVTRRTAVADRDGSCSQKMPWYLKAQWVVYNMATTAALVVTLAYWVLLWKPATGVSANNFHVHAYNSIHVMIDLFITATPIRLLHIWHPVLYGLIYLFFTVIYLGAGGTDAVGNTYIYGILDFYGDPTTAVIIALVVLFVGMPLLWLFAYGMMCLRVFLSERCCPCGRDYRGNKEHNDPTAGHSEGKGHSVGKGGSEGKGHSQDKGYLEDKGLSEDKEQSGKKVQDEEMGNTTEKPATSEGDGPSDRDQQSTVFVTDSSRGHDNKAFDNTDE